MGDIPPSFKSTMIEDKFILSMLDPNIDYSPNYKHFPNHKKSAFKSYAYAVSNKMESECYDKEGDPVEATGYQLDLNLERADELIDKLKIQISRYEDSFVERIYSEKWLNLVEVLNNEEDLKDEFKNLIVNLKLRGYVI